MYGCTLPSGGVSYRCGSNTRAGKSCGYFDVREDQILPAILEMLGQEIDDLASLTPESPELLIAQAILEPDRGDQLEAQTVSLKSKIDNAVEAVMSRTTPGHGS